MFARLSKIIPSNAAESNMSESCVGFFFILLAHFCVGKENISSKLPQIYMCEEPANISLESTTQVIQRAFKATLTGPPNLAKDFDQKHRSTSVDAIIDIIMQWRCNMQAQEEEESSSLFGKYAAKGKMNFPEWCAYQQAHDPGANEKVLRNHWDNLFGQAHSIDRKTFSIYLESQLREKSFNQ